MSPVRDKPADLYPPPKIFGDVPSTRISSRFLTNPWRQISYSLFSWPCGNCPLHNRASLFRIMSQPEVTYFFGFKGLAFVFFAGYIALCAYTPKLSYPAFTLSIHRSSSCALHQNDRLLHVVKWISNTQHNCRGFPSPCVVSAILALISTESYFYSE